MEEMSGVEMDMGKLAHLNNWARGGREGVL
jgi:hypothetical protein